MDKLTLMSVTDEMVVAQGCFEEIAEIFFDGKLDLGAAQIVFFQIADDFAVCGKVFIECIGELEHRDWPFFDFAANAYADVAFEMRFKRVFCFAHIQRQCAVCKNAGIFLCV